MSAAQKAKRIEELNDQLRARVMMPVFGKAFPPGAIYMTRGIASLGPEAQIVIAAKVRSFDDFSEDNDPYRERDFGAFGLPGAGKIFWKIDYYADETGQWGADDPSDPEKSFRVLTIMLAEEY